MPTALVLLFMLSLVFIRDTSAAPRAPSSSQAQVKSKDAPQETSAGDVAVLTAVQASPELIEFAFSAPVAFQSATLRDSAGKINRFFMDVSPALLSQERRTSWEIAAGPVRRVRTSLFRAGVVRIVLDLREARNFQVQTLTAPYRLLIVADGEADATSRSQSGVQPVEAKPTANTWARSVEENPAPPLVFPEVKWRVMMQPWTLTERAQTAAADATFPLHATLGASEIRGFLMSPNLISILEPSLLSSSRGLVIEAESRSTAEFSIGWEWAVACQGGACVRFAAEPQETANAKPVYEQQEAEKIRDPEEGRRSVEAPAQPALKAIRTGGSVMHELWVAAMTAGVFLSFLAGVGVMVLWNLRKRGPRIEKGDGWEGRMANLEEALTRAGMLNSSFFHSLEISQKRLEALLTQADVAEQSLRRLLHQTASVGERPSGRGPDALATAALLLSEGEETQQVARLLKLPMAQVRLLQELRQYTHGEKPAEAPAKSTAHSARTAAIASLGDLAARLNGVARNGMHLAENEQSL